MNEESNDNFLDDILKRGMKLREQMNDAVDDDKTKDAVVLDVTSVDDEAIAVLASVPATLTQKLSRIITVLRAAFAEVEG